jgi:hypothetical protein
MTSKPLMKIAVVAVSVTINLRIAFPPWIFRGPFSAGDDTSKDVREKAAPKTFTQEDEHIVF